MPREFVPTLVTTYWNGSKSSLRPPLARSRGSLFTSWCHASASTFILPPTVHHCLQSWKLWLSSIKLEESTVTRNILSCTMRLTKLWLVSNPLINDFGLSRLYTFQNLREAFLVLADTDIAEYVRHSTELLDDNSVYRFSRELMACLVAFSPYHVANDPFVAVPMETYYDEALARYKKVPYESSTSTLTRYLVYADIGILRYYTDICAYPISCFSRYRVYPI
jgi:hypothetical protein